MDKDGRDRPAEALILGLLVEIAEEGGTDAARPDEEGVRHEGGLCQDSQSKKRAALDKTRTFRIHQGLADGHKNAERNKQGGSEVRSELNDAHAWQAGSCKCNPPQTSERRGSDWKRTSTHRGGAPTPARNSGGRGSDHGLRITQKLANARALDKGEWGVLRTYSLRTPPNPSL